MLTTRIAINGFGRIGRVFFREAFENPHLELVAINDPHDNESSGHLLRYDSNYGPYRHEVSWPDNDHFLVNGKKVLTFHERDPKKIPWKKAEVDIVIEATGVFRSREELQWHLDSGAKKVILTAPPKGKVDHVIVMGVNEKTFDPKKDHIISNASCTTNSLAPLVKVLHETFGIVRGFMTTVHSFTNDQSTLDAQHKDLRRARTASQSIIPTTTGAAEAVTEVIPDLKGKLTGLALRVPTTTVSVTDFVAELNKPVTAEILNSALEKASEKELKGILKVSYEPLVSVDYKGSPYSSIVDGLSTMVIGNNLVKVLAWYDNESGYSNTLLNHVIKLGSQLK